ncbi:MULTISPECIES: hypothetical protein [unclassified Nocardioides]|uniref:hypothetical protein n=1 Tax=unclassified Nocardioides TaxID=2615069 RepID=UPI0012E39FB3|nr:MULTISPECIES: hypothetical protein [unclassified Nocardioides]
MLAIVLGGLRLHDEWVTYQFLRDVQGGASFVIATSDWDSTLLLAPLLGVVFLAVSVVWLAAATWLRAPRHLAAVGAIIVLAIGSCGTLITVERQRWQGPSTEPHLLTPTTVAALVLVLDGIAALAVSWWSLRTDQSQESSGSQPVQANS